MIPNQFRISPSAMGWLGLVLLCSVLAGLIPLQTKAQMLKSTIDLDITRLSQEKQKRIEGLPEALQQYIDDSRWTDEQHNFEVPLSFIMAEMQDLSTTYEDRYSTKLRISNNRDIQYQDKYCRFPYQVNDPLFRDDTNYDPLTGLVDFYVYMVLGGEMDKRAILGGTPFYQKAEEMCTNAGFGRSEFHLGWDRRKELIEHTLSKKMETFRKLQAIFFRAKVYHVNGEGAKARQYCRVVILELGKMYDKNSEDERVKDFFKYHYFEIGELFEENKDPALFQRLIELDPDHREEYEKYTG